MARRRLNKKVALIGLVVFAVIGLGIILVVLGRGLDILRDPEPFIRDGDAAMQAAAEAEDKEARDEFYKQARENYGKAHRYAKTDALRVDLLFKLSDLYIKTEEWQLSKRCWDNIVKIDPDNIRARFSLLKYFYIMANNGVSAWSEIEAQASEFLGVGERLDILEQDTGELAVFDDERGTEEAAQSLGAYLYLLRGRANFEMARAGQVTNPDEVVESAIRDFNKVRELEPSNTDVFWYLAKVTIKKGELDASRGLADKKEQAQKEGEKLLEEAVRIGGDNPATHTNRLKMKLEIMFSGVKDLKAEQLLSLEGEYLNVIEKFPESALGYSALGEYYSVPLLGPEYIDKAIEAFDQARELDPKNVPYAIKVAELRYRKFIFYKQKGELYEAIKTAKEAVTFPGAQDAVGPRMYTNKRNRLLLYSFLANCYIEQVLEPCEPSVAANKDRWIADAEDAVYEIEQLYGSGTEPQVEKWRGMLDFARGEKNRGIRQMYSAYEQYEASMDAAYRDSQLAYMLSKVFRNTAQLGAVHDFLLTALRSGIYKTYPEALLDWAEICLQLMKKDSVRDGFEEFDRRYGPNARSRRLRIMYLIKYREFDEAERKLGALEPDDVDTVKLKLALVWARIADLQRREAQRRGRADLGILSPGPVEKEDESVAELKAAEMQVYKENLAQLVEKLLPMEPNSVEEPVLIEVCNYYRAKGDRSRAEALVNQYLARFPENITVRSYSMLLAEPDLENLPEERMRQVQENVIAALSDPVRRAFNLGMFYRKNNEADKASAEFRKVLEASVSEGDGDRTEEMIELKNTAAEHLLDMALEAEDWQVADRIAEEARQKNLDQCGGNYFGARVATAKEQYEEAAAEIDACLKQRPVFSRAYVLRSGISAKLGKELTSIEDAQKAVSLNPLDGAAAKNLAFTLYRRNEKLGSNLSSEQRIETRQAFDRALSVNPNDLQFLSIYAEFISPTDPANALAIRQSLQKNSPSIENARLLARQAMRMGQAENVAERKNAFFDLAGSAFEQARAIDPKDNRMLQDYASYWHTRGMNEKAVELLERSGEEELLWRHHVKTGQFEKAKVILDRLYQSDGQNSGVIKGLILVAQRTGDREAADKYTQELISVEDTEENRLLQIQIYLSVGLVKEAEEKLRSFNERRPDDPNAIQLGAWLAMRQGKLKEALELANRNLETNQENAGAWSLRGQINNLMTNHGQAILDFQMSKSLSNDPATRFELAKAYLGAGQQEDAITELKDTINDPEAPVEARGLLEQVYLVSGRGTDIAKFYAETLNRFPESIHWHNRAGALFGKVGNYEEAERLYRKAWEMCDKNETSDTSLQAFDGYLRALVSGKKYDTVFSEASKYTESYFAPVAFIWMGQAKLDLGDRELCTEYCRKAVDKTGTNVNYGSLMLQRMYQLLGAEEVRRYCEEKLRADPNELTANLAMYNLARMRGEYNKASDYIDNCLRIIGREGPERLDYVRRKVSLLQQAFDKTSDKTYLEKALDEYKSLLDEMPNDTNVLNNMAYMLAQSGEKGRLPDALKHIQRVYELKPNDPRFLDTYSYVLYKNGDYVEAERIILSAFQQFDLSRMDIPWEVYEHKGMIKEELGKKDEALEAYEQALKDGESSFSQTVKERILAAIARLKR